MGVRLHSDRYERALRTRTQLSFFICVSAHSFYPSYTQGLKDFSLDRNDQVTNPVGSQGLLSPSLEEAGGRATKKRATFNSVYKMKKSNSETSCSGNN